MTFTLFYFDYIIRHYLIKFSMRFIEILKVVFLLLGTVIGAGFASGREVFMFFGQFNLVCLVNIILCGICFFLVCFMFLSCHKKQDFGIFQRSKIGVIFDVIMIFFMFISVSALTAALTSAFGVITSLVSLMVAILFVFWGISCLKNLNFILVPLIIFILCFVSFSNFNFSVELISTTFSRTYNAFLYVGMNIFLASEVLVDVGKKLTKRECVISSVISSVIFCLVLLILTLGFSYGNITNSIEMPILKLSLNLKPIFFKIYLFVLWAGIFTTLTSIIYSLKVKARKVFSWNRFMLCVACGFAFLLSFFGFSQIVNVFYPFEGAVGIIYCAVVFVLIFACSRQKI